MKRHLPGVIVLAIGGAIAVVGLGYLGQLHPAFDTFSHLRLHVSAGLIGLALSALVLSRPGGAGLAVIGAVAGLAGAFSGTSLARGTLDTLPDRPVYGLFHMNLLWSNERYPAVLQTIRSLDPEFISLTEVSQPWQAQLEHLRPDWPHLAHCPEWGVRGGIMILSKVAFDPTQDFCGPNGSFMLTRVEIADGVEMALGSVHPRWPWPASGPKQYRAFQPALGRLGPDALIAGDFNAVPWSRAVRDFARTGGLDIVPGIGGSWLAEWLAAPAVRFAGLPIDHVMHKGRVRIIEARTLDALGSDHLPVHVRFQFE